MVLVLRRRLASARHVRVGRRLVAAVAVTAVVLSLCVTQLWVWPILSPQYTSFGVDRHRSVMLMSEKDVVISQLQDQGYAASSSVIPAETVGVFVVVDELLSQPALSSATHNVSSSLRCLPAYRYEIFVVASVSRDSANRYVHSWVSELAINGVTDEMEAIGHRLRRECVETGATSVVVWSVQVNNGVLPSLVADLVTEAYVDNITWYDVIFVPRLTSPFPVWRQWPPTEIGALRVGAGVMTVDVTVRLAFHRTHVDIFGDSWPQRTRTAADVASYLQEVYRPSEEDVMSNSYDSSVGRDRVWLRRYVNAISSAPQSCLRCQLKRDSAAGNRKVISMSLYGYDPRYTLGALRNAQLLPIVFPGWTLRFYCSTDSLLRQIVERLVDLGAEVKDVTAERIVNLPPMLWRMSALDDPSVDVLLSRDADSRLTDRDAAMVSDWLSAHGRPAFHCVRDHPSHSLYSINGGLWGARRLRLLHLIAQGPVTQMFSNYKNEYLDDMRFLDERIWSPLYSLWPYEIYCHDSVSCKQWLGARPLAVPRLWPGEHVGQVFNAHSRPRQADVDLMFAAERNSDCEPAVRF